VLEVILEVVRQYPRGGRVGRDADEKGISRAGHGLIETPPMGHLYAPIHDHDIATEAAPSSVLPPLLFFGLWNRSQRSLYRRVA
jgi:hypothetical protein